MPLPVRFVAYTTRYREGGSMLRRAAETLAASLQRPDVDVRCEATETRDAFREALGAAGAIEQLHVVGHSGMYGPMFGSQAYPEQFSPHEWRQLHLPFTADGEAWFHACRTGQWFAPFFARTFGVPSWGHTTYTTFSQEPTRYVRAPLGHRGPLWVIGQPGKKSHGWLGAIGKHAGLLPPAPMRRFTPTAADGAAYDRVAALYDAAFADIRVRGPEWAWIDARVPAGVRLLDVGCGTGGLLRALGPRLAEGVGVDVSDAMLDAARARSPHRFVAIDGPNLPFPDAYFDVVVSLLSWRYLDADPILAEVRRVLAPGGRFLVVDMVAQPPTLRDWPHVAAHAARRRWHERRFPGFSEALDRLVSHPDWERMLRSHPIRADHELRWTFASRFPGCRVETLDIGRRARVLAVDVPGALPPAPARG